MQMVIEADGEVRCVYSEAIDVSRLGVAAIRRASHVEPTTNGEWLADLAAVGGPVLGPFVTRSEALDAELVWLESHWLLPDGG